MIAAAALIASTASAQTLKFSMGGTPIEPNSTVSFNDFELTDYGGGEFDIKFDPKISITGSATGTINCTAKNLSGYTIQLCCGGECNRGETVVKSNIPITAGVALATDFELMGTDLDFGGKIPENVKTELSAVYTNAPASEVKFTIIFNDKDGSVSVIEGNRYVYFDGESLHFNLDKKSDAAIYDMTGKCVLSTSVEGDGAISASSLAKGVYIYKVGTKSGKMLVK